MIKIGASTKIEEISKNKETKNKKKEIKKQKTNKHIYYDKLYRIT